MDAQPKSFTFEVDKESSVAPWMQLRKRIAYLISSGYYQPGDQLPKIRELAADISINFNTVNKAYLSLQSDGYVKSIRGKGVFVSEPKSEEEALSMLLSLSGKTHYVHTGVAVLTGERLICAVDTTAVTFRAFDEREALAYVKTGEPMDKAGAYGIQGLGGALVLSIEGAYDNVVGLPRRLLDNLLCEASND